MLCRNCTSEIDNTAVICPFCKATQFTDDIETQIDCVERKLKITGHSFSDIGRFHCGEWIKEFGILEVCEAVEISLKQYLKFSNDGTPEQRRVDIVFKKIPGICANRKIAKEKPYMADVRKIFNYAARMFSLTETQEREYKKYIERVLYVYSKQPNYDDNVEELFWKLKKSSDKWEFLEYLEELAQ